MYTAVLCMLIAAPLAVLAGSECLLGPPVSAPIQRSGESGMAVSGVASSGVPSGANEQQLYQAVLPFDQYAQGYGGSADTGVQRVDNQPQELPVQEENQAGQDQTLDHQLPDEQREGQVNLNKEIHSYTVQRKTININNRILHRYLKNLLVRTIYNTNIAKVNHQKLINVIIKTLQETHQPKLLVKYTREDRTKDNGERNEQPEVTEEKKDNVLPPVFEPATAEKIGYDGNALGAAVSAGGGGAFSSVGSSSFGGSSGSSSSGSLGGRISDSSSYGGSAGSAGGSSNYGGSSSGSGSSNYGGSSGSSLSSRGGNYDQSGSAASSVGLSSGGRSGYSGSGSSNNYQSGGGVSQRSGSQSSGAGYHQQ